MVLVQLLVTAATAIAGASAFIEREVWDVTSVRDIVRECVSAYLFRRSEKFTKINLGTKCSLRSAMRW